MLKTKPLCPYSILYHELKLNTMAQKQPNNRINYQDMTREELYELAREKGIPKKSDMNKEELIHALETYQPPQGLHAELHKKTLEELYQLAKEKNISKKWDLDKEELIQAIEESGSKEESTNKQKQSQSRGQRGAVNLRQLMLDDLIELAEERNIDHNFERNKEELIEVIQREKK